MTALVALDYGGDPTQTEITVSQEAASIGESTAGLRAGDVLTLEAAIKALMIPSGNDAGQALAESLGPKILEELQKDKSIPEDEMPQNGYDAFVYAMNKKALALGMNDAHFSNPHGLDYDQFSGDMHCSAQNVSIMARAAMENELFRSVVATPKTTISVKRGESWVDLIAAEDCAGPNFLEGIGIWWSRLTGGDQAKEAESEVVSSMPIIYGADATR